jgi:hypothetical protein
MQKLTYKLGDPPHEREHVRFIRRPAYPTLQNSEIMMHSAPQNCETV